MDALRQAFALLTLPPITDSNIKLHFLPLSYPNPYLHLRIPPPPLPQPLTLTQSYIFNPNLNPSPLPKPYFRP